MRRVVLHIDRLVLRGVGRTDAAAVEQALRAELGTLLAADAGAALATQGNADLRRTAPLTLASGADAAALGRAIAARITGTTAVPTGDRT